ncbi:MAG: helix-turn-helix domain-containing protein [Armatimonadetes bacterium]|nr:helix-turn-helix domain-containing protein [Armatimonadota bacterium]MDW8028979.1 helix-turn-helix domain-containing protein [Armatimonadota bacterium]
MEKFYRLTEVARLLRVSPLTVRRWIDEGKLKAFHPIGTRLYRVPESSLRQFVGEDWWRMLTVGAEVAPTEAGKEGKRRRR